MKNIFLHINEAAVACAIIVFVFIAINELRKGKKPKLEAMLASGLAASAIPTGCSLLLCAFKPDYLQLMSGFNIHIATAGCALIFISIKGIFYTDVEQEAATANNGFQPTPSPAAPDGRSGAGGR